MAVNCAKLAANVTAAACKFVPAGIQGDCVLINFDDWKAATITKSGNVISAIALATGGHGYHIVSHDKAFTGSYSMTKGTYVNGYVHQLVLRSFDRTQDVKDFVNVMTNGRFVALVINMDTTNDATKYEVYGGDSGLKVSASTFDSSNTDGVINEMTLASEDGELESRIPDSFYNTDLATTAAAYEALYEQV